MQLLAIALAFANLTTHSQRQLLPTALAFANLTAHEVTTHRQLQPHQ